MIFEILKKKARPHSSAMQKMANKITNWMPEIKELKKEERISVSGAPQVENDPLS